MEKTDLEDFNSIIKSNKLPESDFELSDTTSYPKKGVGPLSGEVKIKFKPTGIGKSYALFGPSWHLQFEKDLKSDFYKTRQ